MVIKFDARNDRNVLRMTEFIRKKMLKKCFCFNLGNEVIVVVAKKYRRIEALGCIDLNDNLLAKLREIDLESLQKLEKNIWKFI